MNAINWVLNVDRGGRPISWMTWQDAARLLARQADAWQAGPVVAKLRGGTSAATGRQSCLPVPAILATRAVHEMVRTTPPLTNAALFARDGHTCLYCGATHVKLTRDHVVPRVQGGTDTWENVVAACQACNSRKGGRTPEQANMPLLAIPFRPNWAEWLICANRKILADQMAFLQAFAPARQH